ncbi:MAG: EscU/YscU/HrcU family type III secretion system export apparatus switch protein [Candidatus Omnitrophota bacterium]
MESKTDVSHRQRAVALRYLPGEDDAPVVVAKGKGFIADKIIAIAEANAIPLYQDPDLVEILSAINLSAAIPPELYQAVAEVLAFVYRMNEKFPH